MIIVSQKRTIFVFLLILAQHFQMSKSTISEEPLVDALKNLRSDTDHFEKWISVADLGETAANNILGLLKLQVYISTLLSMQVITSQNYSPSVERKVQQLVKSVKEIGDLDQNSDLMKARLQEATDIAKNLLQMSQKEGQIKDNGCMSFKIAIGAAVGAIGCGAAAYFANSKMNPANVVQETQQITSGVRNKLQQEATTPLPIPPPPNYNFLMLAGAVGGAIAGAIFAGLSHFLCVNRVDFEAKMRYMELKSELIRIKSIAEQLHIYSGQEGIAGFIQELDEIDEVVKVNL